MFARLVVKIIGEAVLRRVACCAREQLPPLCPSPVSYWVRLLAWDFLLILYSNHSLKCTVLSGESVEKDKATGIGRGESESLIDRT